MSRSPQAPNARPGHALRGPRRIDRRSLRVPAGRGQGIVEYGLILGIGVLVAVVVLVFFGPQLGAILDLIGAQVQQPG